MTHFLAEHDHEIIFEQDDTSLCIFFCLNEVFSVHFVQRLGDALIESVSGIGIYLEDWLQDMH